MTEYAGTEGVRELVNCISEPDQTQRPGFPLRNFDLVPQRTMSWLSSLSQFYLGTHKYLIKISSQKHI